MVKPPSRRLVKVENRAQIRNNRHKWQGARHAEADRRGGLALALLDGFAAGPAVADDTEVRYIITNGDDDVLGGKAQAEYFAAATSPMSSHPASMKSALCATVSQRRS
jgi:hypothetical protein